MASFCRRAVDGNEELGRAWLVLCVALAAHVVDEAAHDFLGVYNPTAEVLRTRAPWLPVPVFPFEWWISGLVVAVVVLWSLSPFVFGGSRRMRPLAYALGIVMVFNAAGHAAGTLFGRTVDSVRFARPMPGFYSSPALMAASLYLLACLRRSRRALLREHD